VRRNSTHLTRRSGTVRNPFNLQGGAVLNAAKTIFSCIAEDEPWEVSKMEIDSTEVVELIIDVRAAGSGVEGGLAG